MTASNPAAPEQAEAGLELTTPSMGGHLRLRVTCAAGDLPRADRDLRRVAARIGAWARRLSRFEGDSDLCALNADPDAATVPLRPTIAALLSHGRGMAARTEACVDIAMLEERIAAETGSRPGPAVRRSWRLRGRGRRRTLVRHDRVRFDLDGVAKGWIADRALRLLASYPGALVDADGDVALRPPPGTSWGVALDDPLTAGGELISLRTPDGWPARPFGIATSGTSVHRWPAPVGRRHHLIDPSTGRPAVTDVVQATVVAESAGVAECLAKAAVIGGSRQGLDLAERAGAWAVVLLLEDGALVASPRTSEWLA